MRMQVPLGIAVCLAGCSVAFASAYKEVRDFSVTCTNGLTCEIGTSVRNPDRSQISAFELQRKAGPDAPVDVSLSASDQLREGEVRFSVDGKPAVAWPLSRFSYDEETGNYSLPGGPETIRLIDSMRNGTKLAVTYPGQAGSGTAEFSLAGFVAAMIFVDETQGRLEAKDALQVKGSRTSPRPQIRDLDTLDQLPAPLRAQFTGEGTCAFSDDGPSRLLGAFEATVNDGYTLLAVPCAEGGAYNQPYVFFIGFGGKDYQPLPLPVMGDGGPTTSTEAWNIDWNQHSRTLTGFFKGRGLGDCGEWNRWVLQPSGEAPSFVLQQARAKGDCDGNYAGGPEKWPALWPISR